MTAVWLVLAALVLAGCATGVAQKSADRGRAVVRSHPPEGRFVDVGGYRVHAVVRGNGPDLVLIHGSSGNVRDFTFAFVDRMADRYRVIAFDRPGHGYSDPLPRDREDLRSQARHLQSAAEALGADRPIVLGQSYGAGVALAWAVQHPDRIAALVSVSGVSHPWDTGLSPYYRVTSDPVGLALAVPLISALASEARIEREVATVFAPQAPPEGYVQHFGPRLALRPAAMRVNARQRAALKAEIVELAPHYPEIRVPVEIVHGEADRTVDIDIHARALVRDVAGAHLTALPGVGHMPHHVAADTVAAAIDRAAERAGLR